MKNFNRIFMRRSLIAINLLFTIGAMADKQGPFLDDKNKQRPIAAEKGVNEEDELEKQNIIKEIAHYKSLNAQLEKEIAALKKEWPFLEAG